MDLTTYQNLIESKRSQFEKYYENLVSYNEKVNLTSITEKHDVFTKHFLDSILGVDAIPFNASVVDVGSGAGFPGLPLKIVRPDISLTMVDSLNKRVTFLKTICTKLKIKAENVHARAEDFSKTHRETYDVGVARAVAKLSTLLEYLMPLIKVGGIVVAYKSGNVQEELDEAQNAIEILGGQFAHSLSFELPNDYGERRLIIIQKIKSTPEMYPRNKNLPKLEPLK